VCSKDKGQTQVPFDSARPSSVATADTKLSSLMQSGLTRQPDAVLSCEQHAVPDDINIEPSPINSVDSVASATSLSLASKQKAGSAAACSTTGLHSAMPDTALISSAASARHLQRKSAQQSLLFAPAVLPNPPAFSHSGKAPHLGQSALAPQASAPHHAVAAIHLCRLLYTGWQ